PTKFGLSAISGRRKMKVRSALGKCALSVFVFLLSLQKLSSAQPNEALEKVLTQMDQAAEKFRTTEASFVWEQYQKVINDTDVQKGKVYFRRSGKEIQMSADITDPDRKILIFTDSKVQIYQPKIDQITVYDTGKKRDEVESFLVLGFGGRGHD